MSDCEPIFRFYHIFACAKSAQFALQWQPVPAFLGWTVFPIRGGLAVAREKNWLEELLLLFRELAQTGLIVHTRLLCYTQHSAGCQGLNPPDTRHTSQLNFKRTHDKSRAPIAYNILQPSL